MYFVGTEVRIKSEIQFSSSRKKKNMLPKRCPPPKKVVFDPAVTAIGIAISYPSYVIISNYVFKMWKFAELLKV